MSVPMKFYLTEWFPIVGSNRGIGYETAKDLAARGAKVIMACRNMEKAELAKSKIIGTVPQ